MINATITANIDNGPALSLLVGVTIISGFTSSGITYVSFLVTF